MTTLKYQLRGSRSMKSFSGVLMYLKAYRGAGRFILRMHIDGEMLSVSLCHRFSWEDVLYVHTLCKKKYISEVIWFYYPRLILNELFYLISRKTVTSVFSVSFGIVKLFKEQTTYTYAHKLESHKCVYSQDSSIVLWNNCTFSVTVGQIIHTNSVHSWSSEDSSCVDTTSM